MSAPAHVTESPLENSELSAADVAAFLDGQLEGDELKRVQDYLASHPDARQEIIKASRIVTSAPPIHANRRVPRWIYPAAALAAAAAVLVMVRPEAPRTIDRTSTERTASVEGGERIELLSPANGQRVQRSSVSFAWRPYGNATYHFAVTDESGVILFDTITQDTLVTLDPSIAAKSRGKLYWSVEAQAENGSSARSALSELEFENLK